MAKDVEKVTQELEADENDPGVKVDSGQATGAAAASSGSCVDVAVAQTITCVGIKVIRANGEVEEIK